MADTPGTTQKAVKVLVVEDSPTQLAGLRFLLEESGFSVVAAPDGREGLAAAKANAIDLVISDVLMPEMDGYAFCKAIRGGQRYTVTAERTQMLDGMPGEAIRLGGSDHALSPGEIAALIRNAAARP